ncbi:MAG: N-acetyltransferase family protein [Acidimicrobiia bacterium]
MGGITRAKPRTPSRGSGRNPVMNRIVIRQAGPHDVATMNEIYNTVVVDSHVSFDTEPWTDDARAAWFVERTNAGFPVLVAESEGNIVGVAWSGPWRDKAAYRRSAETTVVLDPAVVGRGFGTVLLRALVDRLTEDGYHRAYAIVALPNEASVAVHKKVGYREVGVLDEAGFKNGRYISTLLLEKRC